MMNTKQLVLTGWLTAMLLLGSMGIAICGGSKPCPWRIKGIEVGKWGNGKLKDAIWAHGSFPAPAGSNERPVWYVNKSRLGHSTAFSKKRRLHPGSRYLKDKSKNTVTVKFKKPPYAGSSHSYTFFYDSHKIPSGQHKKY